MKKYLKWLPALLLALALTVGAFAAELHSVTVRSDGAVVTALTAESDGTLVTALYASDGRMLGAKTAAVTGGAGRQEVTAAFTGGVPSDGWARAFLLDADGKPMGASRDSRDAAEEPDEPFVPDTDVFAILYSDGELVFQHGDMAEDGREVVDTYSVDLLNGYRPVRDDQWNVISVTPWYDERENITKVQFADVIKPAKTQYWFYKCTNLSEFENIGNLDTSCVMSMTSMFDGCSGLAELDVTNFDTASVTSMSLMFHGCSGLTELDVSNFDTANVTSINHMFDGCSGLKTLDVTHFDTSCVTNMTRMFGVCAELTTLDVANFDTSNVMYMGGMFDGCRRLSTLDVTNFITSNVTSMGLMFSNCRKLTSLDVSGLDTSNVTMRIRG